MADVPTHWSGSNTAPRFSRAVGKAAGAVGDATRKLLATMQREYPLGSEVRVVHGRGCFFGTVDGWDTHGIRIAVKNARSGKVCMWWAAHVEPTR
jgi:hypothetical protein